MSRRPATFTEKDILKAIEEAKVRGEKVVSINAGTGAVVTIQGPFHSPAADSTKNDQRPTADAASSSSIGHSGSPHGRMQSFQIGNPYDLKLLATIPGGEECEQRIHSLFAGTRHRGEWFRLSKGLLAYIDWLKARKL